MVGSWSVQLGKRLIAMTRKNVFADIVVLLVRTSTTVTELKKRHVTVEMVLVVL
jgi:hypothetical protein